MPFIDTNDLSQKAPRPGWKGRSTDCRAIVVDLGVRPSVGGVNLLD